MDLQRKAIAEVLGTLWLVLGGCGSAVIAAVFLSPLEDGVVSTGIGFLGVSLAFGLTAVVTAAYALGHISGGHFNPAVTLGVLVARRIVREAIVYVVAQVVGPSSPRRSSWSSPTASTGSASAPASESTLAANGFADHSPGGYDWLAALVAEVVLTFFFLPSSSGSRARAPRASPR